MLTTVFGADFATLVHPDGNTVRHVVVRALAQGEMDERVFDVVELSDGAAVREIRLLGLNGAPRSNLDGQAYRQEVESSGYQRAQPATSHVFDSATRVVEAIITTMNQDMAARASSVLRPYLDAERSAERAALARRAAENVSRRREVDSFLSSL